MLEEVAKRVIEFTESYAREFLAISKTIAKVYRYCWPVRVYIGWIFEDPKTANEVSKIFRVYRDRDGNGRMKTNKQLGEDLGLDN